MDGYDPSISGILKEKLGRVYRTARELLPLWDYSSEPLDPTEMLAPKELEIFRLYGANRTPMEIAMRLFLSVHSVSITLILISRKLRIRRNDLERVAAEYVRSTGWSPL
jgi:DNA-binding CsgD family transcriptional regulator